MSVKLTMRSRQREIIMTAQELDPYKNIRPYNDDEAPQVIAGLLDNPELLSALAQYKFPRLNRWFPGLTALLVKQGVRKQLANVDTIQDMQKVIADYMERMIEQTSQKLSFSGLDKLDPKKAYLFISNHRDIAMDPAFVNWGLYHNQMQTVRIAIGDNLLKKNYVSDLMRLNKSFIVNRSVSGIREKLAAFLQLSGYISESIATGHSVWIAQREGRAKDGNDFTDPAIIKMLFMKKKKQKMSFSEAIRELCIVPVSISYEYDPCDSLKARELYEREHTGDYQKSQFEDIDSITQGITGYKGDVHVAFGQPLTADYANAEEAAAAIDEQIIQNYYLHASNKLAADEQAEVSQDQLQRFQQRLLEVPEECREYLMLMYANPLLNKQKLAGVSHV